MNRFWQPVFEPLLAVLKPAHVIELGCGEGRNSRHLVRWCRQNGARLDMVDPMPEADLAPIAAKGQGTATLHALRSLDALPELPSADLVFVDGDHNWYTVYHELTAIWRRADESGREPPVLICHDTGWPYGRRDMYYDPDSIPDAYRHPWQRGPLSQPEKGIANSGINASLANAETEGGPRNGVRTAIEDALATRPAADMRVIWLPVLFGLGVIVPHSRLAGNAALSAFLDTLELSRPWRSLATLLEQRRVAGEAALLLQAELTTASAKPRVQSTGTRSAASSLPPGVIAALHHGTFKSSYRGRRMLLNPLDLANYLALLETVRPRTVFELGVFEGGRTLWLADTLSAMGVEPRIVGIDVKLPDGVSDPRIHLSQGSVLELGAVLSSDLLNSLPHPFLVIEDSAHDALTSAAALSFFDPYLQSGDRIVVEDAIAAQMLSPDGSVSVAMGPAVAVEAFLARRGDDYAIDAESCDRFGYNATFNPNSWLLRR
jgi:cephalosporin hydroxylase